MRTVLVTGGAGFIGARLVRMLIAAGDFVVNLDALTYAADLNRLGEYLHHPRHEFVEGDVCDGALLSSLFKEYRFDVVFHLAAESHVDRSIENGCAFARSNSLGTAVLLQTAVNEGVARFVQVSTDEVYGSLEKNDPPWDEDQPLSPNSPYSASKAAGDHFALAYHKTHGLNVSVTRCCNNYGPHQHGEKLLPTIIRCLKANQPVPVYGDGTNTREWIHVDDHCKALMLVAEKGQPGRVYNIGSGVELSNLQMVRKVADLLGFSGDPVRYVADRKGHDLRYALNCTHIKNELGWAPQIDLEQGLKELL
ncbi:MAG: dTDP-glucose 4,6-dehydratase [Christensenellales bacterium]